MFRFNILYLFMEQGFFLNGEIDYINNYPILLVAKNTIFV